MDRISQAEKHERWLQEIRGQSSDRHLRVVQEDLARDLIEALYDRAFDMVNDRCATNVTLVVDINGPGQIFHGLEEIADYFERNDGRLLIKMAIVDRFRVTCPLEFFSDRDEIGEAYKQRRLIIIDMNNDHKVIRIEMRPVGPKEACDPNVLIPRRGSTFDVDNSL
ncbi:hypothetical protein CSPX01_14029 [Colletotrichum filicis]|nr:hypothetical protein CSPX01_14029 [Colletotrichum filicis]